MEGRQRWSLTPPWISKNVVVFSRTPWLLVPAAGFEIQRKEITVGIWLLDTSVIQVVNMCLIAKWSVKWMVTSSADVYVLCTRPTIWILDQYIRQQVASICPVFKTKSLLLRSRCVTNGVNNEFHFRFSSMTWGLMQKNFLPHLSWHAKLGIHKKFKFLFSQA